ncbi:MAG: hypothetical protein ABL986_02785 [Vicinamibacterales bacterium]
MMNSDMPRKVPGRLVLRIARSVFSDAAVETMVVPAIADLQREAAAAPHARARMLARARGYAGLWAVIGLAALVPSAGAGAPVLMALLGRSGGFLVALLLPLLFASLWPMFGAFISGAAVAGIAFTFVIRAWNDRHPATLARRHAAGKEPEINLSGIPVGGDVGGFLFVVASVVMMLGLPSLRGFVIGATTAAALLACGLLTWRRHHLESPGRRIIG